MPTYRAKAEHLGGTRVRYTCPHGHKWTEDMGRKSLPKHKRLSEFGVRFLARYWTDGVTIHCRRCGGAGLAVAPAQAARAASHAP